MKKGVPVDLKKPSEKLRNGIEVKQKEESLVLGIFITCRNSVLQKSFRRAGEIA